jgi:hypothetical protein
VTGDHQDAISDGRVGQLSLRQAARLAGIGYVMLFLLAIFANFFVVEGLIEPGDAATTAANIRESEGLFRLSLVSFMVVFIVDVVVAWALYIVFRNVGREVSLLTAWFRLVYTVFLGVALVFLFQALQLLSGANYLAAFDIGQVNAQALNALEAFNYAWLIGLAAFGVHLLALGYLIVKSGYTSRILGYVLMVAGAAYVIDTAAYALIADYADYENAFLFMVAVPAVIGELWLGLWLLLRAGKRQPAR